MRLTWPTALGLAAGIVCGAKLVHSDDASGDAAKKPQKVEAEHLPNALQITDKVISGGQPDGEDGFRELRDLGVKTIISVDGARPDVELAKKLGLRYVHLPHGYDGISARRIKELAKAVHDLPAPIYVHCHHGKHRSPAAAAVACVSIGDIDSREALEVLDTAGTSKGYRGLYKAAQEARPIDSAALEALEVEFHEAVEVPPLAEAMVALEHSHTRMGTVAKAGWRQPADHPDLEPAHEALILREHYTELLRTDEVKHHPETFQSLLREGEQAARELEEQLKKSSVDKGRLTAAYATITDNCKACHQKFRDTPLDEK